MATEGGKPLPQPVPLLISEKIIDDIPAESITWMCNMKSATVRQLRHDFGSVLHWIEEGEEVKISKRGRVIALLKPASREKPHRPHRFDFAARLKKRDGDHVFPAKVIQKILDDSKGTF